MFQLTDILEKNKLNKSTAIIDLTKNLSLSYIQLRNLALKVGYYLITNKKDEDRIGIFMKNTAEYIVSYFGILYSGKVVVPIDARSKTKEINQSVKYCNLKTIIVNEENQELNNLKYTSILMINQIISHTHFHDFSIREKNFYDDAVILRTSGSTGIPKFVRETNGGLFLNAIWNAKSWGIEKKDKSLIVLPMNFGFCNTGQMLTHLFKGACLVISDSNLAPNILDQLEKNKISNIVCVPSLLIMLTEIQKRNKRNLEYLKKIFFGGSKIEKKALRSAMSTFSTTTFFQTYGQTEAGPRITSCKLNSKGLCESEVSVGKPIGKIQIELRNTKQDLGEIFVKTPCKMNGYLNDKKETNQKLRDDWINTGDIGKLDSRGNLFIKGRIDKLIITSGQNVFPEEIESVINSYPGVLRSLVFGVSHKLKGETIVAKVQVEKRISINDLLKYCKEQLSDYKVPKNIEIVRELPITYNGKIKRG